MRQTFIFGLERVRELREHAEARAKQELAATLHQRLKGAALLAAASEAVNAAAAEGSPQAGARQSAGDLLAHERWLHALRREHEDAAVSLDRLDTEVDARRTALGDASREREILEKLKERQAAEHRTSLARREGAELDELAMNMHQRRASGR